MDGVPFWLSFPFLENKRGEAGMEVRPGVVWVEAKNVFSNLKLETKQNSRSKMKTMPSILPINSGDLFIFLFPD